MGLANGRGGDAGRELLHRLVAMDVMGLDLVDRSVHHGDGNRLDSRPGNLEVMSQGEHAGSHASDAVVLGEHIFQQRRFPHDGASNGMHASSRFWRDPARSRAYRAKQAVVLRQRGVAADMQATARRVRMLNTGYTLINAGYDVSTFEDYVAARKAVGRRCPSGPGQLKKFEREFGSYGEFFRQLRDGNHQVLDVRPLGVMDVYDIEVFDDEPDDKRPWSEHNFAISPIGQQSVFGTHVFVANTRRAAKMQTLKCWHPDILEFIECKTKEEAKAQALIRAGYEANFNGEAYSSVMFQNANLSVRCSDAFLRSAENDQEWTTRAVTTGRPMQTYKAKMLLDKIALGTWLCGDPGVQYEDTIQRWHTCPNTAPINSSNPCSEYMFIDDSACNLSSLNLMKFCREDGGFDAERFRAAVRIFITAQEILVDHASYPTEKIAQNSHRFRPLGLGFANLGSLLMGSGLPYDSDAGRSLAAAITAIMHGQCYLTSAEHAAHVGPFDGFALNREPMLKVMEMHRAAALAIDSSAPADLRAAAGAVWAECLDHGRKHGYRNSQVTVLAPTGTIAFMMDCDTTGIEPDIALVKYKQLAGGGMLKIVNRTVPMALRKLGYDEPTIRGILDHIDEHDTIEQAPGLRDEHLPVFDCAFAPPQGGRSIHFRGHLKLMAAVQPFLSGAISKTCNVPHEATVEDIRGAYLEGWKLGLKALAIYRDGSKGSQPVSTKDESKEKEKETPAALAEPAPASASDHLPAPARALAAHAQERDPQVRHPGSRGIHQRRILPRRPARRAVHHDGQGGLDDRRPDGRAGDGHLDRPAVRRAAGGLRQQVRP